MAGQHATGSRKGWEAEALEERFVGRVDELERIVAACRAAKQGRGSLTVLSGEAGIGKTRLCQEVVSGARSAGCAGVMARCWGEGGAPALWPWQPVLEELCGPEAAALLVASTDLPTAERDRFARFAAVSEELAAACNRQPTVLAIDDLHAADTGTLLLTRFVARALPRFGLALLLTRRTGEPAEGTAERQLLDEIEHEAMLVALGPFGRQETAEFLAAHGMGDIDPRTLDVVARITDGHPLFLRRVALSGSEALPAARQPGREWDQGAPAGPASTRHGVQMAILQAFERLTGEAVQILQVSAILGGTASISQAAAVAETSAPAVLDAVQQATAAGLVTVHDPNHFSFSHDLVRTALEDLLRPAERLDAHARAAKAIGGEHPHPTASSSEELVRCAHHALAAAPRSPADARLAVAACRAAARSLTSSFAYEQADDLLSAATSLHEPSSLGPPPGQLLVEWAQAALYCGRLTEARARFARAATVVEQEGDPVLLAEVALGLGGYMLTESRPLVERARVQALQRAALASLPDDQVALRARLTARRAAEDFYNGGPVEPVHQALDEARACGDLVALADALSLCHHALFVPEHVHTRLPLAEELVQVGATAGHGVLGLMGLFWRALDLFHLGDRRADRALEDLRQRADALACQVVLYFVDLLDVTLETRAGRFDQAEKKALAALERGEAAGDPDAFAYYGGQFSAIRWLQGRSPELVELMDGIASSPQLHESDFAYRASTAVFAGEAGQREQAREVLDQMTSRGLAMLPRSSSWLVGMMALVELAVAFDDRPVAQEAYELLRPLAELPVVGSIGICCFGSTHRLLGLAALVCGDAGRAVDHLEQAVTANRRLGNRPMVLVTQAELAGALCRLPGARDDPSLHRRAASLVAGAIERADALGMAGRARLWGSQLDELRRPTARAVDAAGAGEAHGPTGGPARPESPPEALHRQGVIRREGGGWLVELGERRVPVGDLVGMSYLADLLTHPDQPISSLALASGYRTVTDESEHEVLDAEARTAYRGRARELVADLAEAEAHADIGRMERLRAELDALVDQLQEATGLGGRTRTFTGPSERARTAVRKALMRAIGAIEAADPEIGGLLRTSITTGRTCTHTPDPHAPILWRR